MAAVDVTGRPNNNLLGALRRPDFNLIAPHLVLGDSAPEHLLYNAGDNVETVYFPCGPSMISYLIPNEDGRDVEIILVGREGAVGGLVSLGHLPAYSKIVVKFGGPFARLTLRELERAKAQSPSLQQLFARYADCLLAQVFQATACNAIHSIEQRISKWILAAMERTESDIVPLTHEQLASMLGVGRSYASRVMKTFKTQRILESRRGSLVVRDRDALIARSCNCNDSVKRHFDDVLRGVYPGECAKAD